MENIKIGKIEMKCRENLIIHFVSTYFPKTNDEHEEMKQHIITCEKCFKELIRLAPKYDPRVAEEDNEEY